LKIPLPTNLRTRLTFWYLAVLAMLLLVYATLVFAFQYVVLTRQIVHDEIQDVETVEGLLFFGPDGTRQLRQDYYSRDMQTVRSFVGMDVHKETISISVAEDGRNGPVRFIGVIPNQSDDIAKMAKRIAKHGELDFCYEAGGCGYNIYRQLTVLGHCWPNHWKSSSRPPASSLPHCSHLSRRK
jgi:hypothetical protein